MLEKIREIIADQLNIEADTITEETAFKEDLGVDSLDLFEIVMAFEESLRYRDPVRRSGGTGDGGQRYELPERKRRRVSKTERTRHDG